MPAKKNTPKKTVKWGGFAVIALAVFCAFLPLPPAWVERIYSRGFFAAWQPLATFASNAVRFAWMDVLAGAVIVAFLFKTGRGVARDGLGRGAFRAIVRAVVWSAALYVVFLAAWGFNYRRERLMDRLPYDRADVTAPAALRLAELSVARVNALHGAAHADGWIGGSAIDPSLAGAFDRVARELGAAGAVVVGRPKRSVVDWYFQRTGVAGMTDPFFLETLVAGDLLPFERPMVVAHEWAHLAGIADEGEANVAGWLACVRGSVANQYSGWLFMYGEAVRAVPADDRARIIGRLAAGPREDLRAIRERTVAHVNPRLSAAGWRVYDSYLKANRVEAGTASYSEVVRLALGLEAARPYR